MFQVYKKFLLFLGVTVLFCITASVVWSKSEVNLVEIKLLDNLDDKRGFCIDIKGHKSKGKNRERTSSTYLLFLSRRNCCRPRFRC